MAQQTDAGELTSRHGSTGAKCTRGCNEWAGKLKEANIQETENGNGVNWFCPKCGKLVGTANY